MSAEVVTTPFGKFLIDPQDLIGSTTKAGTLWDGGFLLPLTLEYGRLGEPGTTILDVGANQGTYSVWLASHGAWRVVAVEAHPEVMQRLKANLDLNKETCLSHVVPLELAAYDESCQMRQGRAVPLALDGNCGANYVVKDPSGTVLAEPLDYCWWLFGERVSLIKIDTEGTEGAVLRGLVKTIEKHHPAILFECGDHADHASTDTLNEMYRWLQQRGYWVREWPALPNNYVAVCRRDK